jgi:hypothetical protein
MNKAGRQAGRQADSAHRWAPLGSQAGAHGMDGGLAVGGCLVGTGGVVQVGCDGLTGGNGRRGWLGARSRFTGVGRRGTGRVWLARHLFY